MVKFGKNGSDATHAAVRLARAATGRDVVLRSSNDAFLGVHDWFIGSTVMSSGVPEAVRNLTDTFETNDLLSVQQAFDRQDGKVAAVILEPAGAKLATTEFLGELRELCRRRGTVLIFDEIVSGFRVAPGGAQELHGITPDLSTFGKAMANGYPISALVGRAEIMELGGLAHRRTRTFLMSSTYGPERASIAAASATVSALTDGSIIEGNQQVGRALMDCVRQSSEDAGLSHRLFCTGLPVSPVIHTLDEQGNVDLAMRTALMTLLIERRILVNPNFFSPAACHRGRVVEQSLEALRTAILSLPAALTQSGTNGRSGICATGLDLKLDQAHYLLFRCHFLIFL